MITTEPSGSNKEFLNRAMEATIRIGLLAILIAWCFQIIYPFVVPIAWGIVIAVAAYPGYRQLESSLGGRSGLASVIFTILLLTLLVVPTVILTGTVVDSTQALSQSLASGSVTVPPPPENVLTWPLVGEPLFSIWHLASLNLEAALGEIEPQLKAIGGWLLTTGLGAGLGVLQFVFAIIISGVLLAHAQAGARAAREIAVRLSGERGAEFTDTAEATVRSVARGILGVALIQSLLAGLGFLAVGVPAAGLWALLCLMLAVVQIGPALVLIPIVIYVFSTADTVPATLFLIWCVFVGVIDNVLKPILLGRGAKVPMVVIFVGAIGGFIASGIIGLFIGAVILTLGYELFLQWLRTDDSSKRQVNETEPSIQSEVD
jgi:predicted PurR-regulated permease PerM